MMDQCVICSGQIQKVIIYTLKWQHVLPSLQAKYFLPFIIAWPRTVCVAVKQVCFQDL